MEDISQVELIEKVSFPNPYTKDLFTHYLSHTPGGFLLAEWEGDVVGYIISELEGIDALIVSVAVSPEHRNRGVASLLMREALGSLCKRGRRVHLQVGAGNVSAMAFYRKFSFKRIGRIKSYYPNGDDAILMARDCEGLKFEASRAVGERGGV